MLSAVLSCAGILSAAEIERLLVPVSLEEPIPGSYGSRWDSKFVITNVGTSDLKVFGFRRSAGVGNAPTPVLQPGATAFASPQYWSLEGTPAAFIAVEKGRGGDVVVSLRVQDLSRQSQTWGTSIPVVRESGAFHRPIHLNDIPRDAGFRTLLRVYAFNNSGASVTVKFYRTDPAVNFVDLARPDVPLGDRTIPLAFEQAPNPDFNPPGYAQLDLTDLPELAGASMFRVEIVPASADMGIWAFVSVANNETQHVTVVGPGNAP